MIPSTQLTLVGFDSSNTEAVTSLGHERRKSTLTVCDAIFKVS